MTGTPAIAAVTLDAAGTLIEVAEPVGTTYARVAARYGIALDAGQVERRFRAALARARPLAFPGAGGPALAALERRWWAEVVGEAFGEGRHAAAFDTCVSELLSYYASADAWRVFPDVWPALRALRGRGLRLAVVSNFDRRLVGLLAGLGVARWLDRIVLSVTAGAAKPDRAIFRHTLALLGVAAGAALHVGDRVREDVAGARAAGLAAALLDRDGRRPPLPPGIPTLRTLAELPALLDGAG